MLLLWMLPTSRIFVYAVTLDATNIQSFLFTLVFYHKLAEDILHRKRNNNSFSTTLKINHKPQFMAMQDLQKKSKKRLGALRE